MMFLANTSDVFDSISILIMTLGVVLVIWIMMYWLFTFKNTKVPKPFVRNTVSSNISTQEIAQKYFLDKLNSTVVVEISMKNYSSLKHLNYKKNVFYINLIGITSGEELKMTGMDLDFILGRAFLANIKSQNDKNYLFYFYAGYILPGIFLWLYVASFIFSIIFLVYYNHASTSVQEIGILQSIYKLKIYSTIPLLFYGMYTILIVFNSKIKEALENEYDAEMPKYVKKNYLDLYSDFVEARKFSRSIKSTYHLGAPFLFQNKYLGPFAK